MGRGSAARRGRSRCRSASGGCARCWAPPRSRRCRAATGWRWTATTSTSTGSSGSIERGRALAATGEPDRAAAAFAPGAGAVAGPPARGARRLAARAQRGGPAGGAAAHRRGGLLDARLAAGEHRRGGGRGRGAGRRGAAAGAALGDPGAGAVPLRPPGRRAAVAGRGPAARWSSSSGIDPGAELVALEAAILRQDPALAAAAEPPAVSDDVPVQGPGALRRRRRATASSAATPRSPPAWSGCGRRRCSSSPDRRAAASRRWCGPGWSRRCSGGAGRRSCSSPGADPRRGAGRRRSRRSTGRRPGRSTSSRSCSRSAAARRRAGVLPARRRPRRGPCAGRDRGAQRPPRRPGHRRRRSAASPSRGCTSSARWPATRCGRRSSSRPRWPGCGWSPGWSTCWCATCEGEPGALPLLSHALVETWRRRDGNVLTVEGYRATGGIRGAVARSADRLYDSLPAEQRAIAAVGPAAPGHPVARRRPGALPGASRSLLGDPDRERVVALLVRARLVTAEEDTFELAHEALARAWPRLQSWLDEDAAGQRILRHLAAAADGWDSLGRPDSELYRGARLDTASEWRGRHPDLTELERAFLDASVDQATTESRALAERARRDARQNRRLRGCSPPRRPAARRAGRRAPRHPRPPGRPRATRHRRTGERRIATARELAAAANANVARRCRAQRAARPRRRRTTRSADGSVLPEAEEALHRAVTAVAGRAARRRRRRAPRLEPGRGHLRHRGPGQLRDRRHPRRPDRRVGAFVPRPRHRRHRRRLQPRRHHAGHHGQGRRGPIWDPATGDELHTVAQPGRHWASGPSFSADGTLFAAAWPAEDLVIVLDVATGDVVQRDPPVPGPDSDVVRTGRGTPRHVLDPGADRRRHRHRVGRHGVHGSRGTSTAGGRRVEPGRRLDRDGGQSTRAPGSSTPLPAGSGSRCSATGPTSAMSSGAPTAAGW